MNFWALRDGLAQGLLYFDKLLISNFETLLGAVSRKDDKHASYVTDLEFLAENGIVFELSSEMKLGINDKGFRDAEHTVDSAIISLNKAMSLAVMGYGKRSELWRNVEKAAERVRQSAYEIGTAENLIYRGAAAKVSNTYEINAVPILHSFVDSAESAKSREIRVVDVIVKSLPLPNDDTPLGRILDFRQDENVRKTLLAFKVWQDSVVKSELTAREVANLLNHLVAEYEGQLKLHRLKYRTGIFNTLVTTSAEVVEHLAGLKFSSAAKALFSLQTRKIALLEAENASVGREVAYIALARERFPVESL